MTDNANSESGEKDSAAEGEAAGKSTVSLEEKAEDEKKVDETESKSTGAFSKEGSAKKADTVLSVSDPYAVAESLRTGNGSIDLGDFLKLTDKAFNALSSAGIDAKAVAADLGGDFVLHYLRRLG